MQREAQQGSVQHEPSRAEVEERTLCLGTASNNASCRTSSSACALGVGAASGAPATANWGAAGRCRARAIRATTAARAMLVWVVRELAAAPRRAQMKPGARRGT